ncbi:hypothetical protein IIC65_06615 [Candidatus Sumerlaeota bacterium]|nr:hypothetical protein [Candidatus Sumerlaeota bacterium]
MGGGLGLVTLALDHLTLGKAQLEMARNEGSSDFAEAERELTEAVDGFRKAGQVQELPRGLLARAELYRAQRDFGQARRDLDEAYEIATLGEMRLFECDVHVECCRMLLAMIEAGESLEADSISPVSPFALFDAATDPLAAARRHRNKADAMVQETGYHRRDPELLLEDAHLMIHEGKPGPAREKLTEARAKIEEMGLHIHDRVARDLEALLEQKSGEG